MRESLQNAVRGTREQAKPGEMGVPRTVPRLMHGAVSAAWRICTYALLSHQWSRPWTPLI